MNIPENLPYRGQVESCYKNEQSFQKLIRQLKEINDNNDEIINKALLTDEDLKILVPVINSKGQMIGVELSKETSMDTKLDRLSENLKSVAKIKILEKWINENNLK